MKPAGKRVDLNLMLKRFKEGLTDGVISRELGCTPQYVSKKRKDFEKEGKLEHIPIGQRLAGDGWAVPAVIPSDGDGADTARYDAEIATLERQRQALGERISALKLQRDGLIALRQLPQLRAERDKYKRDYENLLGSMQDDQKS